MKDGELLAEIGRLSVAIVRLERSTTLREIDRYDALVVKRHRLALKLAGLERDQ
jgi:hypothetical protein